MSTQADTYTCGRCGGTFLNDRTEEAARAEARELFEGIDFGKDTGVICEDCWPAFLAWMHDTYGPPPWPHEPPQSP